MATRGDALGRAKLGDTPEPEFVPLSDTNNSLPTGLDTKGNALVYVGLDDRLVLRVVTLGNSAGVLIRGRVLRDDGQIQAFEFRQVFNGPAQPLEFYYLLVQGYLLDVVVLQIPTPTIWGTLYAQVGLARGLPATNQVVAMLCSGMLTNSRYLSWPWGVQASPLDGQGYPISQLVANPGAGAEWSFTVPGSIRQKVRGAHFTFTTSAVVATRDVTVVVDDGANVLGRFPASITQIASLANEYTVSAAPYSPATLATVGMIPFPPDMVMLQGWRIRTQTGALDVGDAYTNIRINLEQWFDQ
jgi:hypothetical protein